MIHDRNRRSLIGLTAGALMLCAGTAQSSNPFVEAVTPEIANDDVRSELVNQTMGLHRSTLLELDVEPRGDAPEMLLMTADGVPLLIELEPHSVRAASYRVYIQREDGRLVPVESGPERTVRGTVLGLPDAVVAGSMEDSGLHLRINLPWGVEMWLEPLMNRFEGAGANEYVLYDTIDVIDTGQTCGLDALPDALLHHQFEPVENAAPQQQPPQPFARFGANPEPPMEQSNGVKVAELAVDADYEYYVYWGSSVSNVEARINSIINTVNAQYETQTGIRHDLTTIIVRTSSNQPYTQTDAQQLLNQFRNHWNNNHGNISRDVAHLFTGKNLNGGTIGIAWLGVICNLSYGYGLSQSDFNGVYASATDLTAHELGHNWNAGHCTCPQHTMNASITSANNFNPSATIPVIESFRDSRTCLTDGPGPDPGIGACCMSGCFQTDQASCNDLGGTFAGAGTACADAPCGCPSGEIEDCNGNCAPANWVGDGFCDDGSYTYNGVPIYFNCAEFDCDGGDCECDDDGDPGDPGDPGEPGDVINVAAGDHQTVYGSVTSGSYATTHNQDGNYQAIREQHTGGPPQNRISILDHRWVFNVAPGSSYTFSVDAFHTPNNESDHFVFSWSKDNSNYTPMLTVTKTSDNNQYQSYIFPQDVSGTLYIRVQDTDQTPGNNQMDTIYIDHMYILSADGDDDGDPDPDPTPPAAPTGLTATAGNGVVDLSWNNNSESDLAGYNVYRATASGGPYVKLNSSLIGQSSYSDGSVVNDTTYYYIVTAENTAGQESDDSTVASATPTGPGGDATVLFVSQIAVNTVNLGQGNRAGRAVVTIIDDHGNPVQGATVTGTFSSPFNQTHSATTNSNGQATLQTTNTVKGNPSFSFCVTNITHSSLDYSPDDNVVTCGNN